MTTISKITTGLFLVATGLFVLSFVNFYVSKKTENISMSSNSPIHKISNLDQDFKTETNKNTSQKTPAASSSVNSSPSSKILLDVPFVAQAPFGEWSDQRQEDGCEEASSIMAIAWATGVKSISLQDAKAKILSIAKWEEEKYGSYHDTSISDTLDRIIKGYYDFDGARLKKNVDVEDIIEELKNGNVVIAPVDGVLLKNPFYSYPGPERHMLVVVGYDEVKKEFITNDPGTRHGEAYRYPKDVFSKALRDYQSGEHLPVEGHEKNIIVIEKVS